MNNIALGEVIEILMEIQSDWEDGVEYEAFNVAVESTKKQIARKVVKSESLSYATGICPACAVPILGKSPYCGGCGQKLDWN